MTVADVIARIDWALVVQLLIAAAPGWFAFLAQARRSRQEQAAARMQAEIDERRLELEAQRADAEQEAGRDQATVSASSQVVEDLLSSLRYKDDEIKYKSSQIDELRAQIDTMEQRRDLEMAAVHQELADEKAAREALEETLQHAVARVDQLVWVERAYKRALTYINALEREMQKVGIDWGSIDATRVIALYPTPEENSEPAITEDEMRERQSRIDASLRSGL